MNLNTIGGAIAKAMAGSQALPAELRTLPPELYPKMKRGKCLDRVWVAPGFDRSQGVSLGQVTAMDRSGKDNLRETLELGVRQVVRKESPCQLHLMVVGYTPFNEEANPIGVGPLMTMGWGDVTLEGLIQDRAGKVVAAFQVRKRFTGHPGEAIDLALAALDGELL